MLTADGSRQAAITLLVAALPRQGFRFRILRFEAYLELKKRKERLEKSGQYDREARRLVSMEFMQLLSYPSDVIEEKLSQDRPKDPFILES